jgi:hypothetical protein
MSKAARKGNMRFGNYRSLRAAYLDLKPSMTYLAFYKRVKSGMGLIEAATMERQKGGRIRTAPLPWEVEK